MGVLVGTGVGVGIGVTRRGECYRRGQGNSRCKCCGWS